MSSGKGRGYSLLAFFFFFVLFISSEVTAARKLKMHQNNGELLFILWYYVAFKMIVIMKQILIKLNMEGSIKLKMVVFKNKLFLLIYFKWFPNAEKGIVYLTPRTAIRNKPICDGSGPYSRCIPRSKPPKEKCNPYVRGCSLP